MVVVDGGSDKVAAGSSLFFWRLFVLILLFKQTIGANEPLASLVNAISI